ncbi:helix-turn-helix domain-containing protein [Prochlorococcus sp. AH-736-B08]|nr:helix-turn-helix domain-containing protein [Prochlorococcus sp. AH-736-B08]
MAANKKYFTSKEASEYLARSERTLLNMRKAGTLIEGTCWIRKIPQNPNSHVLYNLENCDVVLNGLARASSMEQDLLKRKKEIASE